MKQKTWLLMALIFISALSAIFDGLYYLNNLDELPSATIVLDFMWLVLLALWVDADSKERPEIIRPFEYNYLVFMFLAAYLPYYLLKTRGAFGLFMLVGFAFLFLMGVVTKLSIYYYYNLF